MPRFTAILCLILFSASLATAQRTKPTTRPSATRATVRVRKVVAGDESLAERGAAIVLLSASPVVEHIATTAKTAALDSKGAAVIDSAAVRARTLSPEGDQYAQALRTAKAPLVAQLQSRGVIVLSQAEHLLNAIMIVGSAADLAWARTQPGVKSAEFARKRHLHLNAATALIGAQQVWNQLGGSGNAGKGVRIAIIDSGIDVSNPMFSGAGFTAPSGFPKTDTAANLAYTNGKVIVARNYACPTAAACPGANTFDLSAADGLGHGTGTASAAAGQCTNTPVGLNICGVAPGAYLGNYKVLDSQGNTTDASFQQALNDALADGFTIVNYSIGGDTGGEQPADSTDYTSIHNAVAAGMVVVVSAGNCGPEGEFQSCAYLGDNTIQDPALLPDVITAGASTNSQQLANPLTITSTVAVPANLKTISAMVASTPGFVTLGPAVVVDVTPLDGSGFGCNTLPAGSLKGTIALMRWNNYCSDTTQTNNAATAGAVGSIIADSFPEELFIGFNGYLTGGRIPSTFISYHDGNNLQAFANANPGLVRATLGASTIAGPETGDQVADYSSRGPNNDFAIKPDVLAPGDLYAATQKINNDPNTFYDPTGFSYGEGTSYAAPMTVGALAIIKQQRPTLSPHDLKSTIVNTGSPVTSTQEGTLISVQMTGGGRVNVPAALATTLVADPVSLSFGQVPTASVGVSQSQSVTLKNIGTASETFAVSVSQGVGNAGLQVTTDQSTVSLAAGASATLNLKIALTAAVVGVYEGTVVLRSQSTATQIHIPYWMLLGTPTVGGLVDGASFGKSVAPGDIVSLFGTAMGTAAMGASIIPLPYDIDHTQVTIYGTDSVQGLVEQLVPLFYSSSGQINFQIPYTLTTGRSDTVQVYLQGLVASNSLKFTAAATAPGIFTSGTTGLLVHSGTQALVTAANPATAGEIVTIYCAGLGAVNPSLYEGDPAPIPPATTTLTPKVSIGGTQATVQFSGLTPNLAGLYQINVTIAPGTPSGAQPIILTIGAGTSATVQTFVR